MTKYIALLRGINVGGKNKISMPQLKAAFERAGFENVVTYINSGNVIFDGGQDEYGVRTVCEELIFKTFGLKILVGIITAAELRDALIHAPEWWHTVPDAKHNVVFVISPATVKEIIVEIGAGKPEYEKVDFYGKVIFWSAPLATFSRTRLSKIVENKKAYNAVTIRNSNTALKLAELAQ